MLDYSQYLKQHSLFKYVKLPSRAKQLQENDFTLLLVLHTYLYIVIIWMTVSSQYRKCWTISKRLAISPFFSYDKVEGVFL